MTTTTQNEAWGFYGAIRPHADPAAAWPLALEQITRAVECDELEARPFLDSRWGRHFADDVAGRLAAGAELGAAIAATVDRWMGWTIGRRTSRETGIPSGIPFLAGFVQLEAIAAGELEV